MTTSNGLELSGVSVSYEGSLALDEFGLSVAPGEILAVVGPSGSGKSTLLRAVAGLVPITSGTITLGGRDLAGVPTHRRGLGLMFQDNALFPHLSVGDNVAYGLKMAGLDGGRRSRRVDELLELVGLAGFVDRPVQALSGGEAQRVALARALAPSPGLLMLDEPLGSLDRALREELTGELRRLLGELGQTAIHVTHDQGEAFALADRVAVLIDGRLVQVGTAEELWFSPVSLPVARFVGHGNEVEFVVDAGGESVSWAGVKVGGRPEVAGRSGVLSAIIPAGAIAETPDGPFEGRVVSSRFARGLYTVAVDVVGVDTESVLSFDSEVAHRNGAVVSFAVDIDRCLFFG